jgi:hypothetical protein
MTEPPVSADDRYKQRELDLEEKKRVDERELKEREFNLEEARLEQERKLKEQELKLLTRQLALGRWSAPLTLALAAGLIGLIGSFFSSNANREIERNRQQGTLILEAIKTNATNQKDKETQVSANLLLLADAGAIRLPEDNLEKLRKRAAGATPSLPAAVTVPSPVQAPAKVLVPVTCPNGAKLLFAAIAARHPIDDSCSESGDSPDPDAENQNRFKNNFCAATPQPPQLVTPQELTILQATASRELGVNVSRLPSDRASLQRLGEGKVVRMKGYLVAARYADLNIGESVNCHMTGEEGNDIHIALAADAGARECDSVTAEISPHYRPPSWSEIGKFHTSGSKDDAANQQVATRLQAQPYRITGQLFYDASHRPCPCDVGCNPKRASLWEIHPVYAIEVCKTGSPCDAGKDNDWVDFDTWWQAGPAQPDSAARNVLASPQVQHRGPGRARQRGAQPPPGL